MYRGLEVVVDSIAEIDDLADQLGRKGKTLSTRQDALVVPGTIDSIVESATADQRTLLKYLVEHGQSSDDAIREALNLNDNKQLAGMTAGLSKRLASARISTQIINSSHRSENGNRVYRYEIPEEALEDVKKGLGM